MRLHTGALYSYNADGRITGCNQINGGLVPRFHLARTDTRSFCVFRQDVPDRLVESIVQVAVKEPPLDSHRALPVFHKEYVSLLSDHGSVEAIWHGSTYRFTNINSAYDPNVVEINSSNMDLLKAYMADWLDDVQYRHPFVALVDDGHAVAVCVSARMTPKAHEAGVETVPSFRQRGYATRVVAAWAKAVSRADAEPLYSTSWDNHASQAVARALNLELVGTDFHIR
ncbi:MAG: GNAT family N-acetyltransferase [Phycisphaerales bacterium]|nr:GNAT family N-acetyltransferase [Phycisphaerales bacterium]